MGLLIVLATPFVLLKMATDWQPDANLEAGRQSPKN
ncbi:hypothetical protein RCH10_003587 [Variovorax sp. GrIS 2.14]|jgi:hypothetical protein